MIVESIYFKGHRCFNREWSGFATTAPVNLIIGRNNSGKSHLLDLVEVLCSEFLLGNKLAKDGCHFRASGVLREEDLRRVFQDDLPRNRSPAMAGPLGNHGWTRHGRLFVGARIEWEFDATEEPSNIVFKDGVSLDAGLSNKHAYHSAASEIRSARMSAIKDALKAIQHKLSGTTYRKLLSERDISEEPEDLELKLDANGNGATNIVRRFMLSSNQMLPRETVHNELRCALNAIFASDGHFLEVTPIYHDEDSAEGAKSHWEIYFTEKGKEPISLSKSGSGLKTVLLVLLNLLAVPIMHKRSRDRFTFAFEELENNLHPALLRRLFRYIEHYAVREGVSVFLSTHSSVALDYFGRSQNAQIVHVTHDGETARAITVTAHLSRLSVVSELGAKPSDLLHANGIIWVEGPSDRIYINRWIEIYTEGRFQEGRDYQCAFYGGALLAGTQVTSSEDANPYLANLLTVNSNIVVVCDGDRKSNKGPLKKRVLRIQGEVSKIPRAHIWITSAKEIENYVPGLALSEALDTNGLPDPMQFECIFPRKESPGASYLEKNLNRRHVDKTELAILATRRMTEESMMDRFDWKCSIGVIVRRIEAWNSS